MGEILLAKAVKREKGFWYYVDGEGNVCRAKTKGSYSRKITMKNIERVIKNELKKTKEGQSENYYERVTKPKLLAKKMQQQEVQPEEIDYEDEETEDDNEEDEEEEDVPMIKVEPTETERNDVEPEIEMPKVSPKLIEIWKRNNNVEKLKQYGVID